MDVVDCLFKWIHMVSDHLDFWNLGRRTSKTLKIAIFVCKIGSFLFFLIWEPTLYINIYIYILAWCLLRNRYWNHLSNSGSFINLLSIYSIVHFDKNKDMIVFIVMTFSWFTWWNCFEGVRSCFTFVIV